jgi:hypothetical protein
MNLPDGTGLDVVRAVRSNPARAQVPIVILSADVSPTSVNAAYVLGANSYIGKHMSGRSISETMTTLYQHWLKDARLPSTPARTRTHQFVMGVVRNRSRKAAIDMQIAEQLGQYDGEFWMNLALREGNLANLFAFLDGQLEDRELPTTLVDEAEATQRRLSQTLDDLERQPVRTRSDAERYMRAVVANVNVELVDRLIGRLFPNPSMAMAALRDVAATVLDDMAAWISTHATAADLRSKVAQLRQDASRIRLEF